MELRRIRGAAHGGNPCEAAELGILPRRMSWRRVTNADRRARRPGSEPNSRDWRQRADFLERPHPARPDGAMAGAGTCRRQVLRTKHGQLERAQLRAQLVEAGDSTVERHEPRGLVKASKG